MLWIDSYCKAGTAPRPESESDFQPTIGHLLKEMQRLHIGEALVISTWAECIGPDEANAQLFEDTAPHAQLHPVPVVVPEGGERFLDDPAAAIDDHIRRGAAAGLALPKKHKFVLTSWCAGKMLEAMQNRSLPLMVCMEDISPDHLHTMLQDFPRLPVVLQGIPREGYQRNIYPLLHKFANLYVSFAVPHSVHLGFEYMVKQFGAERFVWGTNYPRSEGGASITGLTYAGISDTDREAIAGRNVRRLMREVRRG